MLRRIICLVLVVAQLVACAPGQGQFQIPNAGNVPAIPNLPGLKIPGVTLPGLIPSVPQIPGQAQQLATQALYTEIDHILGDDLPIKLDASTAYAKVTPPQNFSPTPIQCTPDNMDMQLAPGDYTCQVRLYCMRDSVHRPGAGIPYELGPLQGKQAEAIGTLLARGTFAGTPPTTLQTISWEIQASIPVSQMPAQHQQVVRQLIPEYEQGLQGDFLQQIEATYGKYGAAAGLPSFDAMLAKMGETGRTIQQIRRSREIIRQNALNYERLDEEVYDKSEGGPRTLNLTGQPPSSWSQIRPGVIAQLVVQQGNLGLNTLNFRVLPGATKTGAAPGNSLVRPVVFIPGEPMKMAATAVDAQLFITLAIIFGIVVEGTVATHPGRRITVTMPTDATPIAPAQTLAMTMNNNGGGGGSNKGRPGNNQAQNKQVTDAVGGGQNPRLFGDYRLVSGFVVVGLSGRVLEAARGLTAGLEVGKGLPVLRGKHGADLNLAVWLDAVPPHCAGHECGTSIPPIWPLVHASYARPRTVTAAISLRHGFFCARDAAPRR